MINRLNQLRSSSPDIQGAAIVSADGLPIASVLSPDVEEDRVAAMSAAMASLGERITAELGRGQFEQVYIKGDIGFALLTSVGPDAVLTVIASSVWKPLSPSNSCKASIVVRAQRAGSR